MTCSLFGGTSEQFGKQAEIIDRPKAVSVPRKVPIVSDASSLFDCHSTSWDTTIQSSKSTMELNSQKDSVTVDVDKSAMPRSVSSGIQLPNSPVGTTQRRIPPPESDISLTNSSPDMATSVAPSQPRTISYPRSVTQAKPTSPSHFFGSTTNARPSSAQLFGQGSCNEARDVFASAPASARIPPPFPGGAGVKRAAASNFFSSPPPNPSEKSGNIPPAPPSAPGVKFQAPPPPQPQPKVVLKAPQSKAPAKSVPGPASAPVPEGMIRTPHGLVPKPKSSQPAAPSEAVVPHPKPSSLVHKATIGAQNVPLPIGVQDATVRTSHTPRAPLTEEEIANIRQRSRSGPPKGVFASFGFGGRLVTYFGRAETTYYDAAAVQQKANQPIKIWKIKDVISGTETSTLDMMSEAAYTANLIQRFPGNAINFLNIGHPVLTSEYRFVGPLLPISEISAVISFVNETIAVLQRALHQTQQKNVDNSLSMDAAGQIRVLQMEIMTWNLIKALLIYGGGVSVLMYILLTS